MASKRENEENEVGEMLGKSNGAAKRLDHMPRLLGFCGLLFDPGFLVLICSAPKSILWIAWCTKNLVWLVSFGALEPIKSCTKQHHETESAEGTDEVWSAKLHYTTS